jgi:hypothetical protein
MNINLSVIIVSFNTRDLLRNCIKSVYETVRNVDFEIIVVDNGSNDGSPGMIEAEFKYAKLIRNSENMGFAKANNQAMRIANGRYILLLNSDTILKDRAIETLVMFMEEHPEGAAVGPKVLNVNGTLQSKGGSFPSILWSLMILFRVTKYLSEETLLRLFPRYYWKENIPKSVDAVNGCCFLIRKDVVNKIGSFSEDFIMYGEEDEWCYRAKQNNYEIFYVSDANIVHLNESSPLPKRSEVRIKSTAMFYKKTLGVPRGIIITASDIVLSVTRLFGLLIRLRNSDEYGSAKTDLKKGIIIKTKLLRLLIRDII